MQNTVEMVIDSLFIVGTLVFSGMTVIGSLLNSRPSEVQQTRVIGKNSWMLSASFGPKLLLSLLSLVIVVALGYLLWRPFVSVSPDVSLILRGIGLVLFLLGLMFLIWARWTLGANWALTTSGGVQLQIDHQLIQRGPYALVRHPMYLGGWTATIGAMLAYHTWTALIMLLLSFTVFYRARIEEEALAETFGDVWRTYTARVPGFFPHLR